MFYTGVGSRNTPPWTLMTMTKIAIKMSLLGYVLRSGGAEGADTAFEQGVLEGKKEIYYADNFIPYGSVDGKKVPYDPNVFEQAKAIAGQFHPAWNALRLNGTPVVKDYPKRLHGRNAFQILGVNLAEPASYCICWTPDAVSTHAQRRQSTGGTGTAISIGDHYKVPIINLANPSENAKWTEWAHAI
jgi:hypothetical protein